MEGGDEEGWRLLSNVEKDKMYQDEEAVASTSQQSMCPCWQEEEME